MRRRTIRLGEWENSVIVSGEELIQITFSVPDLAAAMDWWTDAIGIGPWFVLDRIGRYRSTLPRPAERCRVYHRSGPLGHDDLSKRSMISLPL